MKAPDDDELRFKSVIDILKHTSKIDAPTRFESDLMRRINTLNYKTEKVRWWFKIITPTWIVPSIAAISLIIAFFILNLNTRESDNPFFAVPKLRETVNSLSFPHLHSLSATKLGYTASSLSQSFVTKKEGLNFLQIRLSESEQNRINKLKTQISGYLKENLSRNK